MTSLGISAAALGHAGVSRLRALVERGIALGAVQAVIEDDGIGFEVDGIRDGTLGLVGMREPAPHPGTTRSFDLEERS